ncbi:MAG: hypothetical protein VKP57_11300 [Candidatus Sericytochromatia bacterium]|nr:hypothetical protein [Candidatus Sericytochromatia bacterium]
MSTVQKPQARAERRRPRPVRSLEARSTLRRHPILSLMALLFIVEMVLVIQVVIRQHGLADTRAQMKAKAQDIADKENELAQRESLGQIGQRARQLGLGDAARIAYFPPPASLPPVRHNPSPAIGARAAW